MVCVPHARIASTCFMAAVFSAESNIRPVRGLGRKCEKMAGFAEIKLGICTDTHGEYLPRWDGRRLDAVLHGGDVYDAPALAHGYGYLSPRAWAASQGVPVLAVRGNHDYRDMDGFFSKVDDISGAVRRLSKGLLVAGVGLAPEWYCDAPGEGDLGPQCCRVARMALRQATRREHIILLTHYPPRLPELACGGLPVNGTYECVADMVGKLRPTAVVFGHLHDWFGRHWRQPNGTLVVNPGPAGGVLTIGSSGVALFQAEL